MTHPLARRGVEQRQLAGLITQRSWVRIPPPLPERRALGSTAEGSSHEEDDVSGDFSISGSWSRFHAFAARAWFFLFVLLVTLFLLRHRTELAELRHFPIVRPQWLLLTSAAQGLVLLSIIWQLRLLLAASGFSVPLS